ncbi:hypothetical protein BGX30_001762 [Mortierella sp. GBA39]|nr:hypothetical protein BGX30_001762 [Mortierella sp. GBA39]
MIIKALGGGMCGTPFFKVNDPTALPEHFQEAFAANAAATSISASSPSPDVETEEEDIIIETADGTFLEESITTSVEDTISGDAKPPVDESVEPLPLPSLSSTTANTTATAATPSTDIGPSTPIPSSNNINNNNNDSQGAESAIVLLPMQAMLRRPSTSSIM